MNSGKTHDYFSWASDNAMVPLGAGQVGERRPDYVVKSDDDSFIILGELEKRLRVLRGRPVYWGCESPTRLLESSSLSDGSPPFAILQTLSRTFSWAANATRSRSTSSTTSPLRHPFGLSSQEQRTSSSLGG